jgi:hypothetical protein
MRLSRAERMRHVSGLYRSGNILHEAAWMII